MTDETEAAEVAMAALVAQWTAAQARRTARRPSSSAAGHDAGTSASNPEIARPTRMSKGR